MTRGWALGLCAVLVACGGETAPDAPGLPVVDGTGQVPDLVCPGSLGCASASGTLRAGAAIRAITPAVETWSDDDEDGVWSPGEAFDDLDGDGVWDPVWIAGFGQGRAAQGVHDDVWSRVLVLEQGEIRVALVTLDLVGLFHHDVVRIRQAAESLDLDHVIVATTHNHEGPDTMGIWGPSVAESGYDEAYVTDVVVAKTVEALQEASDSLREVRMRYAVTEAPDLVNDTREPIVIDQALTALQLLAVDDGAPVATTVVWGNHPEALGSRNALLTSDYAHDLRETLEEAYPGGPALFFSGSLGGLSTPIGLTICPDAGGEDTCPQGTYERAERIGEGAAQAAIAALDGAGTDVEGAALALKVRRNAFLQGSTNTQLALAFTLGLLPRTLHDAASGQALSAEEAGAIGVTTILDGEYAIQTEVNLLELGPLAIATAPGELYPELWLDGDFQEEPEGRDFPNSETQPVLMSMLPSGSVPVILNNANDALGYIIPKPQWDETPPYAYVEEGEGAQYGEENSLGHDTAPAIAAAFDAMMRAVP